MRLIGVIFQSPYRNFELNKGKDILDYMSDCYLFRRDPAPHSYCVAPNFCTRLKIFQTTRYQIVWVFVNISLRWTWKEAVVNTEPEFPWKNSNILRKHSDNVVDVPAEIPTKHSIKVYSVTVLPDCSVMESEYLMYYVVTVLQDTPQLEIRAISSGNLNLHTVPHA
jgi:hypothetical protein